MDEDDELPLEYRLWLEDGLSDDQRAAAASASPFDHQTPAEDWLDGFGWDGWGEDPRNWL